MPGLIIKRAVYGIGNVAAEQTNVVDVTEKLQSLLDPNEDVSSIEVSFKTFDIDDPAPGKVKCLSVEYYSETGPTLLVRGGKDGSTVTLTNGSPIEIISATYGGPNYGVDVKSKLSTYFDDPGVKDITIGGAYFLSNFAGGDPDPGQGKCLSVTLKYLGQTRFVVGYDGESLSRVNDGNNSRVKIV